MSLPISYSDKVGQLLPNAERQAKIKPLTDLAKKYGYPTIGQKSLVGGRSQSPLAGTFKSGFTPLSPFIPGRAGISKRRIHNYQKRRFFGFTAAELVNLGAMTGIGADPYDESFEDFETGQPIGLGYGGELDNPIHPIYEYARWETRASMPKSKAPVPVRGDVGGYWLASNKKVWKAIEPSLRLASLCLTTPGITPWWDALFNGDIKEIDPVRIPAKYAGTELFSFHERPEHIKNMDSEIKLLQSKFKKVAKSLIFRFTSGYCHPTNGVVERNHPDYGLTMEMYPNGPIVVSISIEIVQPLLSIDMNYNERMLAQFVVASTILHETAHAIWRVRAPDTQVGRDREPYFENERLCELGWSCESKIWNGQPVELHRFGFDAGGPGLPRMSLFKGEYFVAKHSNPDDSLRIPLVDPNPPRGPDPFYSYNFFPVPITWFKDLQKSDKWKYLIKKFGLPVMAMGPLTLGSQLRKPEPDFDNAIMLLEKSGNISGMYMPPSALAALTDEERRAVDTENARQKKARSIRSANQNLSKKLDDYITEKDIAPPVLDVVDSYPCKCPDYQKIKNHLINNRSHNQLAFDTMEFDIPEPILLRYIQDSKKFPIGSAEFRSFLHCCNVKGELFKYEPFPGPGMVTKISTGWPRSRPARISRVGTPDPDIVDDLRRIFRLKTFRNHIYNWYHEFRDIDFELLRQHVNLLIPRNKIGARDFPQNINQLAIENPELITIGPRGIARMRWAITEAVRNKDMPQFLKDKTGRGAPPPPPVMETMTVDDIMVDDLADEGVLI